MNYYRPFKPTDCSAADFVQVIETLFILQEQVTELATLGELRKNEHQQIIVLLQPFNLKLLDHYMGCMYLTWNLYAPPSGDYKFTRNHRFSAQEICDHLADCFVRAQTDMQSLLS